MRVGLMLCDHIPEAKHSIGDDYPGLIASLLALGDESLDVFDARLGDMPSAPGECDAYVVSGSRSSVNDDEQWIRELEAFVRGASEGGVPILGICFGLQLIAKALGGTVEPSSNGWAAGIYTMQVRTPRPWMDPQSDTVRLAALNDDTVVSLPPGASILGSTDHCEAFLVEFSGTVAGIQGHPEFPPDLVRRFVIERRDNSPAIADKAIASLATPDDGAIVAQWMRNLLSSHSS